ncbi:winged helix-turn-helix transcriptional regulator [Methanoculleus sp. Wushi-C6]|uniref:Winged helix-turn-helix transcriptional regulator n=1 Tax=Methanoculleus caldifontis TaxID=2651577 RepID=A0ABU3WZD3_9EURY|nr:MarR family winged helix-turn-helix transcriptional regulator [Methanoculleus sp. Wushi-C6]MDV2481168.1 winged helix-turn-helix transcriptional regulator [Methanoculleus sp. Wushi-C6]
MPDDRTDPATEFLDRIIRVLNKAAAIEREPVDIGHGVLLYPSEVHLIDVAGRYPEEGVSDLAARLGITKGAVSQTAKKLEEKGYLERVRREGDSKAVLLRLTGRGDEAFAWHRAYHAAVNRRIAEEIGRDDADRLMAVLARMEEILDECPAVQAETIRRFRMADIV